MSQVTVILENLKNGDSKAAEELLPLVYNELRRLASSKMAAQPAGHTLQATALVHEAWLRLTREEHDWKNREHFFSAAAEAMRRILIDQARKKLSQKRGGKLERIQIDEMDLAIETGPEVLLKVHEVLTHLEHQDPLKAQLIKLRFFVGMSISEAADALNMSPTTAKRHWNFARAWLYDELSRND